MKGFTLFEVLVTVLIFSLIIASIFGLMRVANESWDAGEGRLALQQGLRQAIEGMIREARQSSPGGVTIAPSQSRVDFTIPDVAGSISYYILNSQLIREYPTAAVRILASGVNSLIFCCKGGVDCLACADSRILEIRLQATRSTHSRALTFALTEQVRLRNE
jgi:prepilin-type N-terminal cleavage/methylation domain-containing protein